MKADLFTCPNVLDLTDKVHEYLDQQHRPLSPGTALTSVVGMLYALWEFTTKRAQAGDIGRHRDQAIARAVHWDHDAGWLVDRLVEFGFLQEHDEHRLIVPDWPQQADKSCHQHVADHGLTFADGTPTRRKPRRNSPADLRRLARELAEDADLERMAYEKPHRRDSHRESTPLAQPTGPSTITRGSFSAHGKEEPPAVVHDFRPTNPPEGHRRLEPISRKEMQERGLLGPDGELIPVNLNGNEELANALEAGLGL